jgi:hypothetical protein
MKNLVQDSAYKKVLEELQNEIMTHKRNILKMGN